MTEEHTTKLDLLVIGELNLDLILDEVESFPELGKEKIARDCNLTLGSSSAIFAANSSQLGLSIGFCGMTGDDNFGRQILRELQSFAIDSSFVITSEKFKTGLTAIFRHKNDRAMITYPGAMEHFSLANIPSLVFSKARHLHISSLFLQPGIKKDLFEIIEQAKSNNMTVSIDTQWDPDEKWDIDFKKLVSKIDFFLPNKNEFLNIADSLTLDEAIKEFQSHLTDGAIVIKQGVEGATYCTSQKIEQIPGHKNEEPVDTIGAGDSFNAGFIYRFLQGDSLKECVKFGNITGAVSTTESGGTGAIKSLDHVHKIAKQKFLIDDITG